MLVYLATFLSKLVAKNVYGAYPSQLLGISRLVPAATMLAIPLVHSSEDFVRQIFVLCPVQHLWANEHTPSTDADFALYPPHVVSDATVPALRKQEQTRNDVDNHWGNFC